MFGKEYYATPYLISELLSIVHTWCQKKERSYAIEKSLCNFPLEYTFYFDEMEANLLIQWPVYCSSRVLPSEHAP